MMVLTVEGNGDVEVGKQFEHPIDKCRNEQRNVARCGIYCVGTIGECAKAGRQTFQWAAILMSVAGNQNTGW